jgi:hypothetical protein
MKSVEWLEERNLACIDLLAVVQFHPEAQHLMPLVADKSKIMVFSKEDWEEFKNGNI